MPRLAQRPEMSAGVIEVQPLMRPRPAETHYAGKVWLRSRDDIFNGDTTGLYGKGAELNIAAFHDAITKGDYSNPTVAPSVRSNLTGILGRLAADRQGEVTWKDMLQTAERSTFDTSGLKA